MKRTVEGEMKLAMSAGPSDSASLSVVCRDAYVNSNSWQTRSCAVNPVSGPTGRFEVCEFMTGVKHWKIK